MNIPDYDIRYTYITDTSYLRQWLLDPAIAPWFPITTEKELEDSIQCWIGFSRWCASLTATVKHVPVAMGTLFLMPYKKVAHHCLFKVVVDPKWQRHGIGSSLVKNLKHLAKNYFHLEQMNIEMFEGNPLGKILEAQGFNMFAKQDHFVKVDGTYRARLLWEATL